MARHPLLVFSRRITVCVCIFLLILLIINNLIRIEQLSKPLIQTEDIYKNAYNYYTTGNSRLPDSNLLGMIGSKSNEILRVREYNDSTLNTWLNGGMLKYDDSLLVEYVKQTYLIAPNESVPYNLISGVSSPKLMESLGKFLDNNIKNGFFIDCGANNGEFMSNTLWLEKEKGWTGILIEADPEHFKELKTKNRKAWLAKLCLSTDKIPKMDSFYRGPDGARNGLKIIQQYTERIDVQCIPLYTILLALSRSEIDFFSLDIEGMELQVLRTIPFDKIFIKTLIVEDYYISEKAEGLKNFMTTKGYWLYEKTVYDSIFVHTSLLPRNFNESKN